MKSKKYNDEFFYYNIYSYIDYFIKYNYICHIILYRNKLAKCFLSKTYYYIFFNFKSKIKQAHL
jgi:hypothetical protein